MATTDLNCEFDYHYLKSFAKYLPEDIRDDVQNASDAALRSGIYQRDRIMEIACANTSGNMYSVLSTEAMDFTDTSDMKTVTLNRRDSKPQPQVLITNIKNKVGPLRVVALCPESLTFKYYFIHNFDHIKEYGRIEFGVNSRTKWTNGECGEELESFEALATKKVAA